MALEHANLLEPPPLVGRVTLPLSAVPLESKTSTYGSG